MKFSIKDFFSKCDQILRELQIWSHLLKKSLMENFSFCAVNPINILLPNAFFLSLRLLLSYQPFSWLQWHSVSAFFVFNSEAYPWPSLTSKMECFATASNSFQPLTSVAERYVFDICGSTGYTLVALIKITTSHAFLSITKMSYSHCTKNEVFHQGFLQ